MNMKKILSIITALGLCIFMTGCGADKASSSKKVKELKATNEILNADINSQKIQLGNTVVKLPITLSELLNQGAEIVTDVNPETEIVEPSDGSMRKIELKVDSWTYTLYFTNYTKNAGESKRLLLKDCVCDFSYVFLDDGKEETNKDIIFPKGVRQGMSYSELKAAWGEPGEEDIDQFYYYKDYSVFSGKLDLETKLVTEIKFSYSEDLRDSNGSIISE